MEKPGACHRAGAAAGAVAVLVMLASISAAAEPEYSFSLEPATTVASPVGGVLDAAGARLPDGRTVLAYWHIVGSTQVMSGVVVGADGTTTVGPVDLATTTAGRFPFSVASDGLGHAALLWVEPANTFVAFFDGTSLNAAQSLDVAGLTATRCLVAGALGSFIVACDSSDLAIPGDSKQVRLAWLSPGSVAPTSSWVTVPPNPDGNSVSSLAVGGGGQAWVAYYTPTPAAPGRFDGYVLGIRSNGNLSLAPVQVSSASTGAGAIALSGSPFDPEAVVVAASEFAASPTNVEVKVLILEPNPGPTRPTLLFASAVALVGDLSLWATASAGTAVILIGWSEDRPADREPSGNAHPTPVFGLAGSDLTALASPVSTSPLPGEFLSFLDGTGAFVEFGGPAKIHGVSIVHTAPVGQNPTPQASPLSSPVVVALVVTAMGGSALVTLANLSDRFKWALLFAVWPLYVALRRDKVLLDNLRRGAILQVVNESPGIRFSELSRRTGIASGVLRHHVSVLEDFGFLSRDMKRQVLRFYPAGKNPIRDEPFREIRAQIVQEIRKAPGLSHAELARRVDVKWTTLLYHAEILEEAGQVTTKRDGRTRRYWLAGKP